MSDIARRTFPALKCTVRVCLEAVVAAKRPVSCAVKVCGTVTLTTCACLGRTIGRFTLIAVAGLRRLDVEALSTV